MKMDPNSVIVYESLLPSPVVIALHHVRQQPTATLIVVLTIVLFVFYLVITYVRAVSRIEDIKRTQQAILEKLESLKAHIDLVQHSEANIGENIRDIRQSMRGLTLQLETVEKNIGSGKTGKGIGEQGRREVNEIVGRHLHGAVAHLSKGQREVIAILNNRSATSQGNHSGYSTPNVVSRQSSSSSTTEHVPIQPRYQSMVPSSSSEAISYKNNELQYSTQIQMQVDQQQPQQQQQQPVQPYAPITNPFQQRPAV